MPLVLASDLESRHFATALIEDLGQVDLLLAPVSGGGLIAGCATAVKALCPEARVVAVEPEAADDYRRSLRADRRRAIDPPSTIADALQVTLPGELSPAARPGWQRRWPGSSRQGTELTAGVILSGGNVDADRPGELLAISPRPTTRRPRRSD